MDVLGQSPAPGMPPISRQSRQHSRRKDGPSSLNTTSALRPGDRPGSSALQPASPEVISSLITSLSVISRPVSQHFDNPGGAGALPIPSSPFAADGSFGVDYGAFTISAGQDEKAGSLSLDDLAASPPVIRTAKPPSGFSPLTAPKSPPSNREGSGLKSILSGRSSASRPSSKGSSLASRDADTQSIGNLSIERGPVSPAPELRHQKSHDSWGKRTSRATKGLMYMSSKERLRDKEDRKRAVSAERLGSMSPRGKETVLAETVINEEPSPQNDVFAEGAVASPRPIPLRDSSLRKTGQNAKRSSRRSSKRNSDSEIIHELEELSSKPSHKQESSSRRKHHEREKDGVLAKSALDGAFPDRSRLGPSSSRHHNSIYETKSDPPDHHESRDEFDIDDGAPAPAVAQGRRRDRSWEPRRRSGRQTPEPMSDSGASGLKTKRSSSRLKRLSGPLSPRPEENAEKAEKPQTKEVVTETTVGYERPRSADSVDDAVESYLCSPRLSQKIRHPQTGRVISFSEVGDSEGSAVFCCVGMGLTRYITAFYDELALTLKLRLITPDRPGVGDSESYSDGNATPLVWPDDVYAICQALKITKFSILAHSAGAIYALATALRMPQHIRGRIHLLAPWIPPSQMSVFGASSQTPLPPTNAIPTSQRILRALPTPILKAANSSFMTATSSSITSSLPKTPKRKRKSQANLREKSDKNAAGAAAAAAAATTATKETLDNKENSGYGSGRKGAPSPDPFRENTAAEDMDRIRPTGASPTGFSPLGETAAMHEQGGARGSAGGTGRGRGHRKSVSSASTAQTAQERREAAILAAAADALADRERQMTYDTRLTHAIWELATTGANPAVDLLVCLERRHTIGFRYVDITRPVVIHHGSRDTRVPVDNVRWLGKTMRRCEVRVLEGEGHGLMASAGVMGSVLMEISKEWEDWMRVTGTTNGRGRERERERERNRTGGPVPPGTAR